MQRSELKEVLQDLAVKDLVDGKDIFDHPCSVAIRVIENMEKLLLKSSKSLRLGGSENMITTYEYIDKYLKEGE
jgi:hypothetical protein